MYAPTPLLAQRLQQMGEKFRSGESIFGVYHAFLLLGAIIGCVAIVWAVNRWLTWRKRKGFHSTAALFSELARSHGLNARSRMLLKKLAKEQSLSNPAQLFLEPERFDITKLAKGVTIKSDRLEELRDRIFAAEL